MKDPEPRHFEQILRNSLEEEDIWQFCIDFLALFRPKEHKQGVPCAIGSADSRKTSLFSPVSKIVPLSRIARVTKQKNFNEAMIDNLTDLPRRSIPRLARHRCLHKYHFKSLPRVDPDANKWLRTHAMGCIVCAQSVVGNSPSSQVTAMPTVYESGMPEEELRNILSISLIEDVDKIFHRKRHRHREHRG